MKYKEDLYDDEYEDELDRMRARRRQKRGYSADKKLTMTQDDDFEYIEDIEDTDGVRASGSFAADTEDSMTEQEPQFEAVCSRRRASSERAPFAEASGRPAGKSTSAGAKKTGKASGKSSARKKKKRGGWKIVLLLAVFLAGAFLYRRVTTAEEGYWTIAVFGVDSRDGNLGKGALSDVEMLCSINRKTGEIRLISVFRDTYLRINNDGTYDKINQAYFKGGHEQAVEALEANLGIHVDDYATFNWKAVINGINVLGGVDVEITDKEFAYINSFITETVNSTGIGSHQLEHSGMNHLDGVQAVAYARLRLMDTDFNRTERQRKILGLSMEKAKQADAKTLKNLVGAVFPQISTSIGVDDMLSVAKNAKKYYIGQTSGFPFSHTEMKIGKKACVIPTTLESNVIQLHGFLYDDLQYTPSAEVRAISARIAEESGLVDPGKDIESGKNVGAEGNTVEGQHTTQPQSTAAPETAPETEPETESAAETASSEETSQAASEESESPESSAETASETTAEETDSGSLGPSSDPFHAGATIAPNGGTERPSADGPASRPSGPSEPTSNAALEAPGQHSTPESTAGPGA